MNYYYADENDAPVGPCTAEQLKQLYLDGTIEEDTWVLPEGATEWTEYSQLFRPEGRSDVAPAVQVPSVQSAADELRGYGGWLAFLGALLIYVGPILTLMRVVRSVFLNINPTRRYDCTTMALLENVGYFVVCLFGLAAGLMLRKLKPEAINTTKLYLAALFLWSVVSVWLPYFDNGIMARLPGQYRTSVLFNQVISCFITLVWVVSWLSYLSKSKRVRATYVETEHLQNNGGQLRRRGLVIGGICLGSVLLLCLIWAMLSSIGMLAKQEGRRASTREAAQAGAAESPVENENRKKEVSKDDLMLRTAAKSYRDSGDAGQANTKPFGTGMSLENIRADAMKVYEAAGWDAERRALDSLAAKRPSWMIAAEQQWPEAQYLVGKCCEHGVGAAQNLQESLRWYRKAAEHNCAIAKCALADCYIVGRGLKKDEAEAVELYREAAEQNLAYAQDMLGNCYFNGLGVPKDDVEAVKWYRKAAEQGFAVGQDHLGACYAMGTGVTKDDAEAMKWYRKAAESGHSQAQNRLGDRYAKGLAVTKDEVEAVKWYRKAAEQDLADAQNNLGLCYAFGRGVTRDEAEAVKWYRKAAEQNLPEAQYRLGYCCTVGRGVTRDGVEAMKWFRKAADQGHSRAQAILRAWDRDSGTKEMAAATTSSEKIGSAADSSGDRVSAGTNITEENFQKIRRGSELSEVEKIMGAKGKKGTVLKWPSGARATAEDGGVVYTWEHEKNGVARTISLMFFEKDGVPRVELGYFHEGGYAVHRSRTLQIP